jgi:hypothetical protein
MVGVAAELDDFHEKESQLRLRARPWRHGGISRPGEAAWRMCRHKVGPAPRLFRERDRWRRRDRRFRSVGRPAGVVAIPAWPIAERGHSSGRCAPRPYMKVPLSIHITVRLIDLRADPCHGGLEVGVVC